MIPDYEGLSRIQFTQMRLDLSDMVPARLGIQASTFLNDAN